MKAASLILILFLECSQMQMDQCFRYPSPVLGYHIYKRVAYETEEPTTTTTTTPKPTTTQPKAVAELMMYKKAFDEAMQQIRKLLFPAIQVGDFQDLEKSRLT